MKSRKTWMGLSGIGLAVICTALLSVAFAATIQGTDRTFHKNGDDSSNQGASQQTEALASGSENKNTVSITCTCDFAISDVHVQLRNANGQDIGGGNDKTTGVKVNGGGSNGKSDKGSASCDASVAANTSFTLTVDVDTDDPTFRLYISFTVPKTKPNEEVKGCQQMPLFDATQSQLSATQSVLCFAAGAAVNLRNETGAPITGATIALPQGAPTFMDEVTPPAGFAWSLSQDHKTATLTGGLIPPGESRDIVVFFLAETPEVTPLETTVTN